MAVRRAAIAPTRAERVWRAPTGAPRPRGEGESSYERIYAVVRRVPRGRVVTYGRVAALAGLPRQARLVGYAMHALPVGTRVPWHRVVNAQGRVSPRRSEPAGSLRQRMLLEREGVRFDAGGRVALSEYGWDGAPVRSRTVR